MLGYVYVLTDSLISVIIIHATNNALAYLFLEITGTQTVDLKDIVGNDTLYWVIYVISFVIFFAVLISMVLIAGDKRRKKREITAVFAAVSSVVEQDEAQDVENKTSPQADAEGNNKELKNVERTGVDV